MDTGVCAVCVPRGEDVFARASFTSGDGVDLLSLAYHVVFRAMYTLRATRIQFAGDKSA